MKKIIFIGGVGKENEFGGELTKNKLIIKKVREYFPGMTVIDTFKSRRSLSRLSGIFLRFFYHLFCPSTIFIFSSSFGNLYFLFRIMHYFPVKHQIILWGIGGGFSKKVADGVYNAKYLRQVETIVVEGQKMKKQLCACGLSNVVVTPNFKELHRLPVIKKYNDGKIHFLFISRIIPDKGVTYILDCVDKLNKNGLQDRYEVDFYGPVEACYREEFERRLVAGSNVRYCQSLDLFKWENYSKLVKYHFMLFPTYWSGEGCPGAVIDAYIAGVPVIASDWNLNKEFVSENETGILVPVHDTDRLYEAMYRVVAMKCDIVRMSELCQQHARRFDVDVILTHDYFDKLLHVRPLSIA